MAESERLQTESSPKVWPGLVRMGAPEEDVADSNSEFNPTIGSEAVDAVPRFSFPLKAHTGITLRNLINTLYTYGELINRAIGSHFYVSDELTDVLKGLELEGESGILVVEMAVRDTNIKSHPVYGTAVISGLSILDDSICFDGFAAPEMDNPSLPYFEDDYIEACRQLAEAMNQIAINSTRIQAKQIHKGNDKYVLHTWLNRLGMKGSDYKTTRRVLTYNLEGFMSHKTEAALERATGHTVCVKYQKRHPSKPQNGQDEGASKDDEALAEKSIETAESTEVPVERPDAMVSSNAESDSAVNEELADTEESVSLSPEALLDIVSISDKTELNKRKSTITADLGSLKTRSGQLENAIPKVVAEIKTIEEKITNLQERLVKKQDSLQALQAELKDITRNYSLKTLELSALEKQRSMIDARQLFDAFVASGKSMDEILGFLHRETIQETDEKRGSVIIDSALDENSISNETFVAPVSVESADKQEEKDSANEGCTIAEALSDEGAVDETRSETNPGEDDTKSEDEATSANAQPKPRRKRRSLVLPPEQEENFQALWQRIVDAQGEEFYTMKGLPFQYEVRGRQIFVNRKGKAITESSLRLAFHQVDVGEISGPHSLKTFGASYVWSIFKKFGVVEQ